MRYVILVLLLAVVAPAHADYLVVVTGSGDVFKAHGRAESTSQNPTNITTGGDNTVYWINGGQLPTDLWTSELTPRYKYTTGGGWVLRTNGDITSGDNQSKAKKRTPMVEQCSSFTLAAGETQVRVDAPDTLPDSTFCIMVMITSGVQTGFWRASTRDTAGVTITFTQNTNEISGVVMFHDGMH